MNQSKKNFKKDFSENADTNLEQEDNNTANSVYNESKADEDVNLDEADADVDTTFAEQADGASDADDEVSDSGKCTKKKKDQKDAVIEELQDKVKRQMAEFDNFRKRTDKEKSTMYEMGASEVIKKLLPVVDNFERGFKSITDEDKETPFAKGMDMVYKQIMKMFEDIDVKPIEAVGVEFNPEVHNAVMHIDDDSVGESIIVEEFEKGYTYKDTVIRHSMVKVAN